MKRIGVLFPLVFVMGVLFLSILLMACGNSRFDSAPQSHAGMPQQAEAMGGAAAVTELFSHTGYNYAPSIIAEGTTRKIWWCGYGTPPGATISTDVIYYRSIDTATGIMSPIQMVFWPNPGQWDGRFTCDPSVIKGQFQNNGQTFTYALYYTATDLDDGTNNRIGVAFSNDGVNWVRYPQNPIIYPRISPTSGYGAGQAATYNRDDAAGIVLFHTDISANAVFVRTSTDGINFGPPTQLSSNGATLIENNDFAYDPKSGQFYAAIELPGTPGDRETYGFGVYRMPADLLLSGGGTWEWLATVDSNLTGAPLNHSPGLVRDGSGKLDAAYLEVYFSAGNNDPDTWNLYSFRRN